MQNDPESRQPSLGPTLSALGLFRKALLAEYGNSLELSEISAPISTECTRNCLPGRRLHGLMSSLLVYDICTTLAGRPSAVSFVRDDTLIEFSFPCAELWWNRVSP